MGKKTVILLLFSASILLAMDDPDPEKKRNEENKRSYLSVLPGHLGAQLLPAYIASPGVTRDNRADFFIERGRALGTYSDLAKQMWDADIDEQPLVDRAVDYMLARPHEESHYNANVISATIAVPASHKKMKNRLLARMNRFHGLNQSEKNKAVVGAIKVCPLQEVIEPMIKAGASVHAYDAGSRCTLLHYAVIAGNHGLVAFLLDQKASPDATDRLDSTPLHYAVHAGNFCAASFLLTHRASVNLWDWDKNNALFYAVQTGNQPMVELLLKHGASIYYYETEEDQASNYIFQKNLLAIAAGRHDIVMLKTLIEGRKVSLTDQFSLELMLNAALISAAGQGYSPVIKFIFCLSDTISFSETERRYNITPDLIIKDHSAVSHALNNDHFGVAYQLLLYSCSNYASQMPHCLSSRRDSLRIAVQKRAALAPEHTGRLILDTIIQLLLSEGTSPVKGLHPSAAFRAAECQDHELLNQFLNHALEKDASAHTKLMFEACSYGSAPAVRSLLQFPVPARVTDYHGDTPLHKAVITLDAQNLSLIDSLISLGADIAAKNNKGETPLHRVMKHYNKIEQEAVAKKILAQLKKEERLQEIDAVTVEGDTPLMTLSRSQNDASNMVKLLFLAGAVLDKRNKKGETALFLAASSDCLEKVRMLLHFAADPNIPNKDGCGPLGKAARNGNKTMIDYLRQQGADLDRFKDAMLREAAKGGHLSIMQWLLNRHANINGRSTSYGNTPLHKATQYRQIDTVKFLLDRGAEVNAKNDKGDTPLDIALTLPDHEIAALLKSWLPKRTNK